MKRIEDWLLRMLQRRCEHPGDMLKADILDGCVDHLQVTYCRRCGSIKTDWSPHDPANRFIALDHCWRRPDPYLWRG